MSKYHIVADQNMRDMWTVCGVDVFFFTCYTQAQLKVEAEQVHGLLVSLVLDHAEQSIF